jgi:hypothetical protein
MEGDFSGYPNQSNMHPKNIIPRHDGFHADGYRDHLKANRSLGRFHEEGLKLDRRLKYHCHPTSLIGTLRVGWVRRKLMKRIKSKVMPGHALFLSPIKTAHP